VKERRREGAEIDYLELAKGGGRKGDAAGSNILGLTWEYILEV
jgi:hypothetical protein